MLTILDGGSPGIRGQVHLRAVTADLDEHEWQRRLRVRAYRERRDWEQYVARVRASFRAALGPLPERMPLRVECTGVLERPGYAIEKLLVETQPEFYATAHVYLPVPLRSKAPTVLNAVGHWAGSKAEPVEQARVAGLARKGYVALIWDPLGQGERSQYWDPVGHRVPPPMDRSTYQHAAVCNPAFLIGSTVVATMLWDGVRMLEYLCSRPEVDPDRVACTGVSGGGTYTMFLGAFDHRLKATVPVCSTTTLERSNRLGSVGEPCQDPIRAYPDELDTVALLTAHAPKALRIIGTRYDFVPLRGLRDAALQIQDGYAALGIPEKMDLQVVDAHHDYNREQRELLYAWLNRWLDHDAPVPEDPFTPEAPETLRCTPTGQLLTSGRTTTAPDLVRALARRVAPAPAAVHTVEEASTEQERVRTAVGRVLGGVPPLTGAPPVSLPPSTAHGLEVERLILQARMDVPLPALVFRPPGGEGRGPIAILVDDRGKGPEAEAGGLTPALAGAGVLALAVDLRGWGETTWAGDTVPWGQDRLDLLGAENMLSYISYLVGHWHVTQRVQDVLGVLQYVRSRPDVDPAQVFLVGRGGGAIVALHAAAVDGAVAGVVTYEALATYRSIVEERGGPDGPLGGAAPAYAHPVADYLPGVLLYYDLPALAAALAPARVLVLDPQGALAEPLTPAASEPTYAHAITLAQLLGGELRVETGWAPGERGATLAAWMHAPRGAARGQAGQAT